MRERGWSAFWTIIAAIAGVVGAMAAVYPLLSDHPKLAHLTFDENADMLRLYALSEPIILTGNWSIKKTRRWLWGAANIDSTTTPSFMLTEINNRRLLASERATLAFWGADIKGATRCSLDRGEMDISVEYRSKYGTGWTSAKLPYCGQPAP